MTPPLREILAWPLWLIGYALVWPGGWCLYAATKISGKAVP